MKNEIKGTTHQQTGEDQEKHPYETPMLNNLDTVSQLTLGTPLSSDPDDSMISF